MPEYSDWQVACIDDLQHTDLSYEELGQKYGRARDTIIKLKKLANVVRQSPPRRVGAKKSIEVKPLSPIHRTLGIKLTLIRGARSYTDIAMLMNVSRHVVKNMELGGHDFSLSQLLRLSEIAGQSIDELTTPLRVTATPTQTPKHDR